MQGPVDTNTIQELSYSGHHQECLQACQKLLQIAPENPLPWKYAGKSLLALGQPEKSQQCLAKAHQLDTNDPEIAKDIGNTFLKLNNTDIANQWYTKSLEINNNYAPGIASLANLKRLRGSNLEAIDLFKRAIQADPQLLQAYLGQAASLLALGNLDQALEIATQATKINRNFPGINELLGVIYQNKKNFQQAVKSSKELGINPKSTTSLLNLGLLLLQLGKGEAAIKPLEQAAESNQASNARFFLRKHIKASEN